MPKIQGLRTKKMIFHLLLSLISLASVNSSEECYRYCLESSNDSSSLMSCSEDEECQPIQFCNESSDHCQFRKRPINFLHTYSIMKRGYCATFDKNTSSLSVGICLNNIKCFCYDLNNKYYRLPQKTSQLNEYMCQGTKRTGQLCGRCLPNNYPLAYSYNMTCMPCPKARWNWLRYIAAAYLPLTLFYMYLLILFIPPPVIYSTTYRVLNQ